MVLQDEEIFSVLVFFVIKVHTQAISETTPEHQEVPESRVNQFNFRRPPPSGLSYNMYLHVVPSGGARVS